MFWHIRHRLDPVATWAALLQVGLLRDRLPAAEVEYAIEDALLQAGHAGEFSTLEYIL